MEIKLKQQTVNCGNLHLPAPVLWLIIFRSEFRINVFRDLNLSQSNNISSLRFGVASLNLIIGLIGLTPTLLRGLSRGLNFFIRIRTGLHFLELCLARLFFGRLKSWDIFIAGGVKTLLSAVEKSQSSKLSMGGRTGFRL